MIHKDYVERIYAGWLGKIIGIRLGAPVENWTHEKIRSIYGEPDTYVREFKTFAADDDSNGPMLFLRALEDSGHGVELTAQDVGDAILNYAPCEHGFFAWGASTENLDYHNLLNNIPAPRSGSIEQNGIFMAEQIGGQIFVDTWGLVAPGNPTLAAKLARNAASATHDGNGVYGGIFVAVCISLAFIESSVHGIIDRALGFIPQDCAYACAIRNLIAFYNAHPKVIGMMLCISCKRTTVMIATRLVSYYSKCLRIGSFNALRRWQLQSLLSLLTFAAGIPTAMLVMPARLWAFCVEFKVLIGRDGLNLSTIF